MTLRLGVGGFFLGLVYGLGALILIVVATRVLCELALSIFSIRDTAEILSQRKLTSSSPGSQPIGAG